MLMSVECSQVLKCLTSALAWLGRYRVPLRSVSKATVDALCSPSWHRVCSFPSILAYLSDTVSPKREDGWNSANSDQASLRAPLRVWSVLSEAHVVAGPTPVWREGSVSSPLH